jgi:hypothetical protein
MTGEGYGTAMEVRGQRADDRGQKAALLSVIGYKLFVIRMICPCELILTS